MAAFHGVMRLPLPKQTEATYSDDEVNLTISLFSLVVDPLSISVSWNICGNKALRIVFYSQEEDEAPGAAVAPTCRAPPYGKRVSAGFVPRAPEDFGDGGAYPEIHVAQYPLDLGRKVREPRPSGNLLYICPDPARFLQDKGGSGLQVALQVGGDGKVRYDAIVKQGVNATRNVFARYEDMVEKVENP